MAEDYPPKIVAIMKGEDEDGNELTVLVDENGKMISVIKGDYQGDLKTVAVDEEGRMIARIKEDQEFVIVQEESSEFSDDFNDESINAWWETDVSDYCTITEGTETIELRASYYLTSYYGYGVLRKESGTLTDTNVYRVKFKIETPYNPGAAIGAIGITDGDQEKNGYPGALKAHLYIDYNSRMFQLRVIGKSYSNYYYYADETWYWLIIEETSTQFKLYVKDSTEETTHLSLVTDSYAISDRKFAFLIMGYYQKEYAYFIDSFSWVGNGDIEASTTENHNDFDPPLSWIWIENTGDNDVRIAIGSATENGYTVIEAGEEFDWRVNVPSLYYVTASGTTTIKVRGTR